MLHEIISRIKIMTFPFSASSASKKKRTSSFFDIFTFYGKPLLLQKETDIWVELYHQYYYWVVRRLDMFLW